MQLKLVRHLWGISEPWEVVFPRIQASGYTAIEAPLPQVADHARFRSLLDTYGFEYVALVQTTGVTMADHLQSFRDQVAMSLALQATQITSHAGYDSWDAHTNSEFFARILEFESTLPILVAHETHRGRVLHHPWSTSRLLDQFPQIRLCADYSHWVVACERMLQTETEIIQQCAERCIHIHARVGHEEQAQVADPRAPEYQSYVETYDRWWHQIWQCQAARGDTISTLTPEYGPPHYAQTLPYTRMPTTNIWEICDWQADRQAAQFRETFG